MLLLENLTKVVTIYDTLLMVPIGEFSTAQFIARNPRSHIGDANRAKLSNQLKRLTELGYLTSRGECRQRVYTRTSKPVDPEDFDIKARRAHVPRKNNSKPPPAPRPAPTENSPFAALFF